MTDGNKVTSNKKKQYLVVTVLLLSCRAIFSSTVCKSAKFRYQQIKRSKIVNPVDEKTKNHRKPTQTHLTPGNSSPIASCLAKSPV